ncbi:unnamed protein product [Rhodiola kirilowii]
MKEVFTHLYSLQLEEDVNEVIFALGRGGLYIRGSIQ